MRFLEAGVSRPVLVVVRGAFERTCPRLSDLFSLVRHRAARKHPISQPGTESASHPSPFFITHKLTRQSTRLTARVSHEIVCCGGESRNKGLYRGVVVRWRQNEKSARGKSERGRFLNHSGSAHHSGISFYISIRPYSLDIRRLRSRVGLGHLYQRVAHSVEDEAVVPHVERLVRLHQQPHRAAQL